MSFASALSALAIPAEALVEQRVPKKLLVEQGAPTTADKRRIQDGVDEIQWVAALKPTTIGVPAYKDEVREYLEVAVLTVRLRAGAKSARLLELLHRAIPYPVVLISEQNDSFTLSLAHKRWSHGEAGKIVIEELRQIPLNLTEPTAADAAFLAALPLSRLPARHLFALYDGILERMAALEAARITGALPAVTAAEQAQGRWATLENHARLQRDLAILRAKAHKEKQLNRRVALNLEIKRLEAGLAAVEKTL